MDPGPAHGGGEAFTVRLRTLSPLRGSIVRLQNPCDQVVTRFAPVTWQMDRGEIVLRAANGQSWRFEEGEDSKWPRVPQTASPLLMVRK